MYFSVITWTTVGYGDFVPTESTRLFAATEAFIGHVWMGLLISVLAWLLLTASGTNLTLGSRPSARAASSDDGSPGTDVDRLSLRNPAGEGGIKR